MDCYTRAWYKIIATNLFLYNKLQEFCTKPLVYIIEIRAYMRKSGLPFWRPSPGVLECGGFGVVVNKVSHTLLCVPHLPPFGQRVFLGDPAAGGQGQVKVRSRSGQGHLSSQGH